jgi:hypothetical protein
LSFFINPAPRKICYDPNWHSGLFQRPFSRSPTPFPKKRTQLIPLLEVRRADIDLFVHGLSPYQTPHVRLPP